MNPAAEKITGFRFDEIRGKTLHDLIHHTRPDGSPYPVDACPIDRALPERSQERGEDVFIHRDGHFYPVAFTASAILESGKPIGTVLELRDATEEKAAQNERERMLAELRAAIDARDEFLSIASHELKTPLTPLRLQLESLRRALEVSQRENPRVSRSLEQCVRQTHRLAKLIENLLDVSRITAGRLVLELESFDLAELLGEVVQRFVPEARNVGSPLSFESFGPIVGSWDRIRIEQVISNLLSNAIKYGEGGPIEVRLEHTAHFAKLIVRDQGIGIEAKDIERIFGRFERAVSIRHFGGLGLGLYIAHQIVEAHGGSIVAESAPGTGSKFTVSLPTEPLKSGVEVPEVS